MSPGNNGKFLTDQFFATDLRVGTTTEVGSAIDVPKVAPILTYVLAAASLATSGFGAFLLQTQGPEAAADYMAGLAAGSSVLGQGSWWPPLTSLLLYNAAPDALVASLLLLVVASEAEAVLGYPCFLAVFVLGGLTACEADLLLGGGAAAAAGAGAAVAAAAAMAGFYVRNPKQKRSWRVVVLLAAGLAAAAAAAAGAPQGAPHIDAAVSCCSWSFLPAAAAGGWLGYAMGPKLEVVVELDIPDGSMVVPDDAREVVVVVDQSAAYKKLLAGGAYAVALAAVSQAIAMPL